MASGLPPRATHTWYELLEVSSCPVVLYCASEDGHGEWLVSLALLRLPNYLLSIFSLVAFAQLVRDWFLPHPSQLCSHVLAPYLYNCLDRAVACRTSEPR